jgi:hypothetical protein
MLLIVVKRQPDAEATFERFLLTSESNRGVRPRCANCRYPMPTPVRASHQPIAPPELDHTRAMKRNGRMTRQRLAPGEVDRDLA